MTAIETQTLWGPGEVRRALGASAMTLKRWRDAGGFPAPLAELSIGPVWDAETVQRWHAERTRDANARKGAAGERQAEAIRVYRQTGNVSQTARAVGAARSSVIAWLSAAGEPFPRSQ